MSKAAANYRRIRVQCLVSSQRRLGTSEPYVVTAVGRKIRCARCRATVPVTGDAQHEISKAAKE